MGPTPQLRIEHVCQRLDQAEVVTRCLDVLAGGTEDPDFIVTLGGPHAVRLLDDGLSPAQIYWLRVWAARGLL